LNIVVDPEFYIIERKDSTNNDISIISDPDESDSERRMKKRMQFY
jgi:hypothetical protein